MTSASICAHRHETLIVVDQGKFKGEGWFEAKQWWS
jgi:hypothetical protein